MHEASVILDPDHAAGPVDRRIFGSFVEHLGRAVYGGVYESGNPLSDAGGLREDVIAATREMGVSTVRYPGGNFVSAYDWRDGVGPRDRRPQRFDPAWRSLEPNTFGTDEFLGWCAKAAVEPMLAVNLGTGSPADAAAWVEYTNAAHESATVALRDGRPPRPVRLWGLGNELDGPWQAGHCTAGQYADRAQTAARLMRRVDPTIQTVAAGSSGDFLPTYLHWDRVVLERLWDDIDFLGVHRYSHNRDDDTPWFLAEGVVVDAMLGDYAALLRFVGASKRSAKKVYLAFDEWNVWYRAKGPLHEDGRGRFAPPLLQEGYNLEDALVAAQYLMAFLRHSDVVRAACLAQLVNALGAIIATPRGVLRQTIFHPFALIAASARGTALRPVVKSPTYHAGDRRGVPLLDAAATLDGGGGWACFLVNRSTTEPLEVTLSVRGPSRGIAAVRRLHGEHAKLANTFSDPDGVAPVDLEPPPIRDGEARLTLPPLSLTVINSA